MNIEKLREVIRKYEENYTTSTIKRMTRFSSGTRYSTFRMSGSLRRQMSGRFRNYLRTRERSAPC